MGAHSAVWQGTDTMALAILYETPGLALLLPLFIA